MEEEMQGTSREQRDQGQEELAADRLKPLEEPAFGSERAEVDLAVQGGGENVAERKKRLPVKVRNEIDKKETTIMSLKLSPNLSPKHSSNLSPILLLELSPNISSEISPTSR